MDELEITPDANDDESDIETDSASDEDEQYAKLTKLVYFYVYLLFYYPTHNTFYFRFYSFHKMTDRSKTNRYLTLLSPGGGRNPPTAMFLPLLC